MAACRHQYRISFPVHHLTKNSRVWCQLPTIKTRHISQIPTRFLSTQMNESIESTVGTTDQIVGKSNNGDDVLYQYVVMRRDLIDTWPLGCIVTQGCHASVSAIWMNKDDSHTAEYCSPSNIDSMHKVTLEVKGEPQILNLSEKLKAGGILHKLWIEEPENIPTCLASKPYPKYMMDLESMKMCHNDLGDVNEKQETKIRHLEKMALHSAIFYILFQATILHTVSKPSRILHWWIPFFTSILVASLFFLTFVTTIIEWTQTRYETDLNILEWEDIYFQIEKTKLGVPTNCKEEQRSFEPKPAQLRLRYVYIGMLLYSLLAYTGLILVACVKLPS